MIVYILLFMHKIKQNSFGVIIMKNKWIVFMLLFIFLTGCTKKVEENNLNIYIDVKNKNTIAIFKFLGEEYLKDKKGLKINYLVPIEEINSEKGNIKEGDIIISDRENMIKRSRKGELRDLGDYYKSLEIFPKYMNIVSSYGRYNDTSFGIGFLPRNIKIVFDKAFWDNNKLMQNETEKSLKTALSIVNKSNIKIPIILDEGMDINNFIYSVISDSLIDTSKLEEIFDSSKDNYKSVGMEKGFQEMKKLYDNRLINKDTFYKGDIKDFEDLNLGRVPFIITSQNYQNELKNLNYIVLDTKVFYINSVISVSNDSKNNYEVNSFLKFLYGEETSKILNSRDYISGDKKYNNDIYKNVLTMFNLPSIFRKPIENKINDVISGKYNGKEWEDILLEIK